MTLNPHQERAVRLTSEMSRVFNARPKIGVLAGAAGTGKSTTLKAILAEIGNSVLVAPTGKAAQRAREITGQSAQTIHKWLFSSKTDERTGEVVFNRKAVEDIEVSESGVLILDEGSMVDLSLWDDVYAACHELGLNILVVGDHAQLPPVKRDDEAAFSLVSPAFDSDWRVVLDEVYRQALDSPIIAAATEIRTRDIMTGLMMLPRVMKKNLVQTGLRTLEAGGIVLCHRNTTRHRLNAEFRAARFGLDIADIRVGEPLLVMKNQYKLNRFNGEVLEFRGWDEKMNADMPVWDPRTREKVTTGFGTTDVGEGGVNLLATLATSAVNGGLEKAHPRDIEKAAAKVYPGHPYLHCNYGYALSIHKSQGSQYPEVLVVVEDSMRVGSTDSRSILYTAITRAETKCSICFLSDESLAALGSL